MRFGVIHDSLNFAGGAEKVCLEMIEVIHQQGHSVTLGTIDKTDWKKLGPLLGKVARPEREVFLWGFNASILRAYSSQFLPLVVGKMKGGIDAIVCTNHDVFPMSADLGYMHYLPLCAIPRGPYTKTYSNKWYFYTFLSQRVQSRMLENLHVNQLLTNSSFSKRMIEREMGLNAEVVYPAVDVAKFRPARESSRKPQVVSVGRLSPEKRFEDVLGIAEMAPQVKFVIAGSFAGAGSRRYLLNLKTRIAKKSLRNVSVRPNVPFEDLIGLLHASKIYLHAARNEHFGLAVVEGMSAGLVPLVHRSGGQWEDILAKEDGKYGYSYANREEAVDKIAEIVNDDDTLEKVRMRNSTWVQSFSPEAFRNGVLGALARLE